jgi:hypothetical protein
MLIILVAFYSMKREYKYKYVIYLHYKHKVLLIRRGHSKQEPPQVCSMLLRQIVLLWQKNVRYINTGK